MNANDLKPANTFAQTYGVKMIGYGPPGVGKTPLVNTAPRPVLLAGEPGLLSMKGSNVPTWVADTPQRIDEFFTWFFKSAEVKNYDTLAVDSATQIAEIYLRDELKRNKDGRKGYGEMSRKMMDHLSALFYIRYKHIYLIAKEGVIDTDGSSEKRPHFPGQELNVQIPHLYDLVAHIAETDVPGVHGKRLAIRTKGTFGIRARDRSGKLDALEPPDLTLLFNKAMA